MSAEEHSTPDTGPKQFEVPSAFQDPSADVILISQEGVEFRAHKALLIIASTFFSNMFADAHPDTNPQSSSSVNERLVDVMIDRVPWQEKAHIIERLLTYVYPIVNPHLGDDTLEGVIELIRAADKWQFDGAIQYMRLELASPRFLNERPLKVFGFSREMGFEAEWKMACRKTLLIDIRAPSVRPDLIGMSAEDFASLQDLRDARVANACALLDNSNFTCAHGRLFGAVSARDSYKTTARDELNRMPTSDVLGSPSLVISWTCGTGLNMPCCARSEAVPVITSRFVELKKAIDALPDTI